MNDTCVLLKKSCSLEHQVPLLSMGVISLVHFFENVKKTVLFFQKRFYRYFYSQNETKCLTLAGCSNILCDEKTSVSSMSSLLLR